MMKLSLLIMSISNRLRTSTAAVNKTYVKGIKEAIEANGIRKEGLEEGWGKGDNQDYGKDNQRLNVAF